MMTNERELETAVRRAPVESLAWWADRTGKAATLVLPLFLLHGRAVAEACIVTVCLAFLIRSAVLRDWSWTKTGWIRVGAVWLVWLALCSAPAIGATGWPGFFQAAAAARYLLFAAALERVVLADVAMRRGLAAVLTATILYISGQALLQFATGHNLQGYPRGPDGELTGPFFRPRAAAPYVHLLFPILIPILSRLRASRFAGSALVVLVAGAGLAVLILIGQRMPFLLGVLGLLLAAVLIREIRAPLCGALAVGAALLASTAVVSPPAFYRLVTKFSHQIAAFPDSDYGLLATRAVVIASQHPWLGRGFDGFRATCPDPATFVGWSWAEAHAADGGGAAVCNIHPHNYYLQAVTDAGIPGLVLFASLAVMWIVVLGKGLRHNTNPLRVGLFVAAVIHLWPIASTTSFYAVEITGIFALLLGWGLAEARSVASTSPEQSTPSR